MGSSTTKAYGEKYTTRRSSIFVKRSSMTTSWPAVRRTSSSLMRISGKNHPNSESFGRSSAGTASGLTSRFDEYHHGRTRRSHPKTSSPKKTTRKLPIIAIARYVHVYPLTSSYASALKMFVSRRAHGNGSCMVPRQETARARWTDPS